MLLRRLQQGLEQLYRIETRVDVGDFVIDAATRARLDLARTPREQLLVAEQDGQLDVGLFVDERALSNLARHDPARVLDDRNLGDFLLTVEGVSHFVYLVWRAQARHPVSQLELELQAEVDKYVTCLLTMEEGGRAPAGLLERLFVAVELHDDLDPAERERYTVANENALRYSASLERRYVRPRRLDAMLAELREFYRLPLSGKLARARAAA